MSVNSTVCAKKAISCLIKNPLFSHPPSSSRFPIFFCIYFPHRHHITCVYTPFRLLLLMMMRGSKTFFMYTKATPFYFTRSVSLSLSFGQTNVNVGLVHTNTHTLVTYLHTKYIEPCYTWSSPQSLRRGWTLFSYCFPLTLSRNSSTSQTFVLSLYLPHLSALMFMAPSTLL